MNTRFSFHSSCLKPRPTGRPPNRPYRMARRKQLNPMQRIPSGEVMEHLADGTTTSRQNGNVHKPIFKWSDGAITMSKKSKLGSPPAGTVQLVVCVAGIYASLYAPLASLVRDLNAHNSLPVCPGLSCRNALPKLPTIAILPSTSFPIRLPSTFAFPSSSIRCNHSLPLS